MSYTPRYCSDSTWCFIAVLGMHKVPDSLDSCPDLYLSAFQVLLMSFVPIFCIV